MQFLKFIFGAGHDLTTLQMCARGFVVFIAALVLIRVAGRRSFGVKTPLDNIITILLGAILSRGVVGASPFADVMLTSFAIVIFHRFCGWLIVHNRTISHLIEGEKILLVKNGEFITENMSKALVCQEDVLQGVRESALTDNLDKMDAVYMERNGVISVVKK